MLAHIYVRHMGDMFGGQMLAKLLPGSNRMFQFENLPQLIANVRQKLDVSLAEESNVAFTHNINMLKDYND
jgi:heme oxygenase